MLIGADDQSGCGRTVLCADDGIRFELHEPLSIDEAGDLHDRARRPHFAEYLPVYGSYGGPIFDSGQQHPSPHDVGKPGSSLAQRGGDDLEASPRLPGRITGRRRSTIGRNRCCAGDAYELPDAYGAREADCRLHRATG